MPTRRTAVGALAGLALAVTAAPALPASVTITPPSPNPGDRIQTTDTGATLQFAWTAETSGCTSPQFASARAVFEGPRPFTGTSVSGPAPNGNQSITFRTAEVDDTFSWYVLLTCGSTQVRSETRTFTLVPPDPAPRMIGRYLVNARGSSSQYWTMTPACAAGACDTFVKIGGVKRFRLRYDPATETYAGKVTGLKARCRKSLFISYPNAYRMSVEVTAKVSSKRVVGASSLAQELEGRLRTSVTPTASGRKKGCAARVRTQALSMDLSTPL